VASCGCKFRGEPSHISPLDGGGAVTPR
jgi:hypothetical protein